MKRATIELESRRSAPNSHGAGTCAICGGERSALYLWNGFQLFHCPGCGTESVAPMPSPEELSAFYQQKSGKKMDRWEVRLKLVERAMEDYLKEFRRGARREKPDSFLDLGGGAGYYVRAAQECGIPACHMDCAEDAMEFARRTLGVRWTVFGDIQRCAEFLEKDRFDFALARHVIEHLIDPDEFVANVARVLVPGGLFEVETPNVATIEQYAHPMQIHRHYQLIRASNPNMPKTSAARWAWTKSMSGVNPPKHLWGFTARGLSLILERNGFEVVRIRRAIAGDQVFDPLFYDFHRLSTRKGLGIPYYFWERFFSLFASRRGMNLAILARRKP